MSPNTTRSTRPELVLYVHGFGGEGGGREDQKSLEISLYRAAEQRQVVLQTYRWASGTLESMALEAGISLFEDITSGKELGDSLLGLVDKSLDKWDAARVAAASGAKQLRSLLQTICAEGRTFSIIAFSMGTQVVRDALVEGSGVDPVLMLHRLLMVGSILDDEQLEPVVRTLDPGRVTNLHAPPGRDVVLGWLYPAANYMTTGAPLFGARRKEVIGRIGSRFPEVVNLVADVRHHMDYDRFAVEILGIALQPTDRPRLTPSK